MIIHKFDRENKFMALFDTINGTYVRTGILENKTDTGIDPFMTSFPELIDIGIMGHCIHGLSGKCKESGVQCYQHGDISRSPNMTFENYKHIIDECSGKTFQVALGGCGDPDQHEDFEEILRYTRDKNIVPNFTASGFGLTPEKVKVCKKYCGAVAVSWYSRSVIGRSESKSDSKSDSNIDYTLQAINMLIDAEVTTNIHYVLSNSTIDEAIEKLKTDGFPKGINAIIFLLHKPVGLGQLDEVLHLNDTRVKEFFNLIDSGDFSFKIGFDSCSVPGILNMCNNILSNSIDTCEGARFSMYVSSDMVALPCSFDNQDKKWGFQLDYEKGLGIKKAWHSNQFNNFRGKFIGSCKDCKDRLYCYGGCPIKTEIVLCNRKEKRHES